MEGKAQASRHLLAGSPKGRHVCGMKQTAATTQARETRPLKFAG